MADSKVEIQVTANAEDAKRTFADVEAAANRAMDAGARSADKLAKSMDRVSESVKGTETNLRGATRALAGMAVGIAASALNRPGEDESAGAAYLKGGVMSGLSAGLMSKNLFVGLAAGAYGVYDTYQQRKAKGEEQAQGVRDAAGNLAKAREEMDRVAERTDAFEKLLATLGNTEADAASRASVLADEIQKRKQGEADATERMKAAEAAMKEFASTIDGPMTKAHEKYLATLDEDWKAAAKDLATNRAERKSLEGQKIEKAKPEYEADRVSEVLSGLERAGIGYAAIGSNKLADWQAKGGVYFDQNAAAMESLVAPAADAADKTTAAVEDGNDIAEKQLDVLKEISAKTTGTAVFA